VQDVHSKVARIQALIPLGLEAVAQALEAEVTALAGEWHRRCGGRPGAFRWCYQRGSVSLLDQTRPSTAQRVRDRLQHAEIPLPHYHQLQRSRAADTGPFRQVLHGLFSLRDEACAEAVPAAFGLSAAPVSRGVIRASATTLRELGERRLEVHDIVILVLDEQTFADDMLVIAPSITRRGEQVILGVVQTATENERVCAAFLRDLADRGLRTEDGLLVVLDGAKGLHPAVQTVFGAQAVVQRGQEPTWENVVRSLPKPQRAWWRRTLQAAYEPPTSVEAKAALLRARTELGRLNESAVRSLDEGLEETLPLHRLGRSASSGPA